MHECGNVRLQCRTRNHYGLPGSRPRQKDGCRAAVHGPARLRRHRSGRDRGTRLVLSGIPPADAVRLSDQRRTGKDRRFRLAGAVPLRSGQRPGQRRLGQPQSVQSVRQGHPGEQSGTGAGGLCVAGQAAQHGLPGKYVFLLHHIFLLAYLLDHRGAQRHVLEPARSSV